MPPLDGREVHVGILAVSEVDRVPVILERADDFGPDQVFINNDEFRYLYDDDDHLIAGKITQVKVAHNNQERLVVVIEPQPKGDEE